MFDPISSETQKTKINDDVDWVTHSYLFLYGKKSAVGSGTISSIHDLLQVEVGLKPLFDLHSH